MSGPVGTPFASQAGSGPRILAFTGKGGVGKSTVAAGTAALAAAGGRRTLLVSTDAAHSLDDTFAADVGADPTPVADRLWVQQVDSLLRFEQSWAEISAYLRAVLDAAGVDPVAAEELTVVPGAEEVFALLELRRQCLAGPPEGGTNGGADGGADGGVGAWDLVVVDCAPTGETLRLLALPEALEWYMQRLFGVQRTVVRALRPVLTRAAGVPTPGGPVFDALERLHGELDEVRRLLSGPRARVRLVLTPERVVLAETRRAFTTLSLFGYRVDGVVANRVFPEGPHTGWHAGWAAAQRRVLREVEESFGELPVWRAGYQAGEPIGADALRGLAEELYGGPDPWPAEPGVGHADRAPLRVTRLGDGAVLRLALPGVHRLDVDLARRGDDLLVTVGPYRRMLSLPPGLARHRVAAARVRHEELQVRFEAVSGAVTP